MTESALNQNRKHWQLNAARLARLLCVHTNTMNEYLSSVTHIPCAVAMHIKTLHSLPDETRAKLFAQRLNHKAHG